MSQATIDRPPETSTPAQAPQSVSPQYVVPAYPKPTAQPQKSDDLSITALVCAVVGIGVSCVPLFLVEPSVAVVVALVGPALLLGVLAALFGAFGRVRAIHHGFGMLSLVVGVLALVWTVGALACNVAGAIR